MKTILYLPEVDNILIAKGINPLPNLERFIQEGRKKYRKLLENSFKRNPSLIISDRGELDFAVWCEGKTAEEKIRNFESKSKATLCGLVICLETYLKVEKDDPRKEYIERSKNFYKELGRLTEEIYNQWCSINNIPLYKIKNSVNIGIKAKKVKRIIEEYKKKLKNYEGKEKLVIITGGSHSGKTTIIRLSLIHI